MSLNDFLISQQNASEVDIGAGVGVTKVDGRIRLMKEKGFDRKGRPIFRCHYEKTYKLHPHLRREVSRAKFVDTSA